MAATTPIDTTRLLERLEAKIDALDAKIDSLMVQEARTETRLIALETSQAGQSLRLSDIEKLMPWVRAGAALLTVLALPVVIAAVGFVWALITHRLNITP